MELNRAGGILLHPTSLPSPDGIGDLGPDAYRWIDFLDQSGCQFWQILPLGPTGFGDSPYQCFSSFAGNPNLISAALLREQGLLTREDLADRPAFPVEKVDYGQVIPWKKKLIKRAFTHFKKRTSHDLSVDFEHFQNTEQDWLQPFAIFMAIKEAQGEVAWNHWPGGVRQRDPEALANFCKHHSDEIELHAFTQFIFNDQWQRLRQYAHEKQIRIIGDIPIFVAYDSADVWEHRELFQLDDQSLPVVVAGVPPDYFSETGQLWGNPLYDWNVHKNQGYAWWIRRMQSVLQMVDIVRLDHFRGFEAYWAVPFGNETAIEGQWIDGPGEDLFHALQEALGQLPIIAEDLGVITEGVTRLRDGFNLPGMRILQFAFATTPDDDFLPHNYPRSCVAYTGTHDNNTTVGWYQNAPEREKDFCRRYLARSGDDIAWSMIRILWQSVAGWVLAPMQDFLSLGEWARMNYPGTSSGNWDWRMHPAALDGSLSQRLYETHLLYGRLPQSKKDELRQKITSETEGQVLPH